MLEIWFTGEQFVSFLVTKVLYKVWQYQRMEAFLYLVEVIARKTNLIVEVDFQHGVKVDYSQIKYIYCLEDSPKFLVCRKFYIFLVLGSGMFLMLLLLIQITLLIIQPRYVSLYIHVFLQRIVFRCSSFNLHSLS